jgi:quercetin dioxygenase-like cupin family protein
MIQQGSQTKWVNVIPGIQRKTLVFGEKTMLVEFRLEKGAVLPEHCHPHEQTGRLISGEMELIMGENTCRILPGDAWCIPSNVFHRAVALEESIAVEVFSPVREDYLP